MVDLVRALSHRNYRLYFIGQLVSLVGTWMQQIAMSWLAYRLTGSALMLGVIGFAGQIPVLLLAPLGGWLSDSVDRRRLLMATQAAATAQAFVLALLTLSGGVHPLQLVLLALTLGCINAVDAPARQSLTVRLVDDPADLPNAIALNSFTMNAARLVGPAAAGFMVSWVGEGICFLLNALSYFAVLVALGRMRVAPDRRKSPRGNGFKEGFAYVAATDSIRRPLLLVAVMGLAVVPYTTLMPLYAREVFGGDARTLGLLMGFAGIGALTAAFRLAMKRGEAELRLSVRRAALIAGGALVLFSHAPNLWLAAPVLVAVGFGTIGTVATSNTLIQLSVEDRLRGRVMSVFTMSFLGLAPIGSLLSGALADRFGVHSVLLVNGAVALVGALLLTRSAESAPAALERVAEEEQP